MRRRIADPANDAGSSLQNLQPTSQKLQRIDDGRGHGSCKTIDVSGGLIACVTFVAGVAAGVVSSVRSTDAAAVALASGSIAIVCSSAANRRRVLAGACLAAAVGYGAAAREHALNSPLASWLDAHAPNGRLDVPARVEGTIAEDASVSDAGVRLTIDVDRMMTDRDWLVMSGRLQVAVAGAIAFPRYAAWRAGRRVAAPVTLRTARRVAQPGKPERNLAAAAPRVRRGRIGQERRSGRGGRGPVVARSRGWRARLRARRGGPFREATQRAVGRHRDRDPDWRPRRTRSGHPASTASRGHVPRHRHFRRQRGAAHACVLFLNARARPIRPRPGPRDDGRRLRLRGDSWRRRVDPAGGAGRGVVSCPEPRRPGAARSGSSRARRRDRHRG